MAIDCAPRALALAPRGASGCSLGPCWEGPGPGWLFFIMAWSGIVYNIL